jgi:hypothetical protein
MKKIVISKTIVLIFVCLVCCHLCRGQDTTAVKWRPCVSKNTFGLDLGVGQARMDRFSLVSMPTFEIGMRYLHYFTPYIGMDFIKFNSKFSLKKEIHNDLFIFEPDISDYFSANTQYMLGLRGNTANFYKCMSGYWAVRVGFGVVYESFVTEEYKDNFWTIPKSVENRLGVGLCMEYETGFNITRELFIGYVCNAQLGNYGTLYFGSALSHAFRMGINIK